jgi:protein-S-isoprenylcysteine O-methyltransferase Ste14
MARAWSLLGSAIFLVLAPGTVAGLVPWWISGWEMRPAFFGISAVPMVGALSIALGLAVLSESFARFALQGMGTPAPVLPTRRLVITGFYRHVRNPMYLAVTAAILGQGLLLGQVGLLIYGACLWVAFHVFVLGYEEPTLRRTYPEGYDAFVRNVPRWWPRLRPWTPAAGNG